MGLFDRVKQAILPSFDPGRRNIGQVAAVGAVKLVAGNSSVVAEPDLHALVNEEKLARQAIKDQFKHALAATSKFLDEKHGISLTSTTWRKDEQGPYVEQVKQLLATEKGAYDMLRDTISTFSERFQKPITFADLMPEVIEDSSYGMRESAKKIKEHYEYAIKHLLPDRKMPFDTPLTADHIQPLKVWDDYRQEASITAEYCDRLIPTARALVRQAEKTLDPLEARNVVHDLMGNGVDFMNVRGEAVKPHLDAITTKLEGKGADLVRKTLRKQAEAATAKVQQAAREQNTFLEKVRAQLGDLVSSGSKAMGKAQIFFFPLSENEARAQEKLQLLEEILGRRSYSMESRTVRHDDALFVQDADPGRVWPEDRYVPVPTQRYVQAYGVDLSYEDIEKLCAYMKHRPHIAKIISPHISDFVPPAGISR